MLSSLFCSIGPPFFFAFCFPYSLTTWVVTLVSTLVVGLARLSFVAFFFPLGCVDSCFCVFLFFGSALGSSFLAPSSYSTSSPKPFVNCNGTCPYSCSSSSPSSSSSSLAFATPSPNLSFSFFTNLSVLLMVELVFSFISTLDLTTS